MATIGLYYPFIHFKDDDWLKVAALYWNRMARIVPPGYLPAPDERVLKRDSDVTRELIESLDFVVNIPPEEATFPVSELFTALLTRHAAELREQYDVSKAAAWPADPVTARYARKREPRLAYVNSAKLHPGLVGQLEEQHLAVSHTEEYEVWAGMHPRLANVYMSALAEELAENNQFHPTSDETLDHVAATGWSLPRLAGALLDNPDLAKEAELGDDDEHPADPWSHEELRASLALISIQAVIPKDPSALTVDKIVEIREEFGAELFLFQQFVDHVAKGLPEFGEHAAPAAVEAHVKTAHEEQIAPLLKQLRAALRGRGVDTVEAAMNTSIAMPGALSPIPVDNPVTFGVAGVLSLVPVLRSKRRQAQEAYAQSPAAYLHQLDRKLKPRTLLQRLGQSIGSFLTGV